MATRSNLEKRKFPLFRLDTYMEANPSRHNVTNAKEFLRQSPANFTVTKKRAKKEDGVSELDSWYVERDDNKDVLCNYVGPDWTLVQNIDKFDWFQPYLDSGKFKISGAGTMKEGQIVSIFAKVELPDEEIVKGDPVSYYIHLYDSFGERSLSIQSVVQRLVCLNGAIRNFTDKQMRFRHKKNIHNRLSEAKEFGDFLGEQYKKLSEKYKFMASRPIGSESELRNYIKQVFGMEEKADKNGVVKLPTRSENILTEIIDLHDMRSGIVTELLANNAAFESKKKELETKLLDAVLETTEAKQGLARGTYWGAYNAVTEYNNHIRGRSEETRVDSLFYGDSARVEQRAFNLALGVDVGMAV